LTSVQSILATPIRDLQETVGDFAAAQFNSAIPVLQRFINLLDDEPLAGFIASVAPTPDFDKWWAKTNGMVIGGIGASARLEWPDDRGSRVAMQIELCRAICSGKIDFLSFVHAFYYLGSQLSAHVEAFASKLLTPLVRDITRLTETRLVPSVLMEAMNRLPSSGDAKLDELLQEACTWFRDPAPSARGRATERLWDAWERLKSLEVEGDKRLSVAALLESATSNPAFRLVLESEAKALTEIGNKFHIRHFETDRSALTEPEQFDYLFHRLYALMHYLIFARADHS
jgi:hypothetical protein